MHRVVHSVAVASIIFALVSCAPRDDEPFLLLDPQPLDAVAADALGAVMDLAIFRAEARNLSGPAHLLIESFIRSPALEPREPAVISVPLGAGSSEAPVAIFAFRIPVDSERPQNQHVAGVTSPNGPSTVRTTVPRVDLTTLASVARLDREFRLAPGRSVILLATIGSSTEETVRLRLDPEKPISAQIDAIPESYDYVEAISLTLTYD